MIPGYQYQSDFARKYFAEGRAEGEAQGRTAGEREFLEKQLTLKFGQLSPETRDLLQRATGEELTRWAERILSANTLGEIFG